MTKETGIIMSGSHPVDILEGRKTMTRRTWGLKEINENPDKWQLVACFLDGQARFCSDNEDISLPCPYGGVGDRLWMKETTWSYSGSDARHYVASEQPNKLSHHFGKVYSSMFMPRKTSRALLEITGVRVERLCQISVADALAEGCFALNECAESAIYQFSQLWDSLNGKKYPWDSNCWVWPIEFRIIKQ